jgi:hypothetical protein
MQHQQQPERHRFLKSWLQDISEELDNGWYRIVPWSLLIFAGIAGAVAFYIPADFWAKHRDNTTVFYGAVLTMNGIILALSWGAFGKIYETIGAPGFSTFLQQNAALEKFLFFVSHVHFTQIIALLTSAIALVITQFEDIELIWQRIALGATIALAAYAIKKAAGAVTVMHTLIRYRAEFDADREARSGNVHRL